MSNTGNETTHGLNEDIAKIVGVNSALIYERIRHYCEYHETNANNFFDGSFWCFNSYKAWEKQFPFFSERQIRTAIEKLEFKGLVKVGNYNRKSYDKTKWYTLLDIQEPYDTEVTPMTQKSEGGVTEVRTHDTEVRPIPEYTHPNIPTNTISKRVKKTDLPNRVYEAWNTMAREYGLSTVRNQMSNVERDKHVLRRLAECNGHELMLFEVIENVPKNPWWIGRGREIFRAEFDWIFKSRSKFRQVLEYVPTSQEIQNANTGYQNKSSSQQRAEKKSADLDEAFNLALQSPLLR